ncbi:hypothetical protein AMAG_06833 [Allomyces macrogynus ATCC 38327]|uniref:Kelch repeat protein n=1 Tax=Allomyces macrogynus (strain ATCC 38327) TaxID=578462 RepID=A0A0L0SF64_ALLM3|nr:hypothetical protein AMAG_06833 [Allomyces macrogynus ATCC 38327]|eukprot:KNE61079.1 hypothetical protein AMAG_06833 [Allomyces macrogynus ATCC 38327]
MLASWPITVWTAVALVLVHSWAQNGTDAAATPDLATTTGTRVVKRATDQSSSITPSLTPGKSQSIYGATCAYVDTTKRFYSFGGWVTETGNRNYNVFSGSYSLDLSRTFSTSSPPFTDHGVLDGDMNGGLMQAVSLVLPNGHILIAGGRIFNSTEGTASIVNDNMYEFDPANNAVSKLSPKITDMKTTFPLRHSLMASSAVRGFNSAYIASGNSQSDRNIDVDVLYNVTASGIAVVSLSSSTKPAPREFTSLGRFNATHLVLSGGSGKAGYQNDVWMLDEGKRAWTRHPYTLLNKIDQHRMFGWQDKYVIRIGGYTVDDKYSFIEYWDASTNAATKGTVVNPGSGPLSMSEGCAVLLNDTVVYMGGRQSFDNQGHSQGVAAPPVSLLKIESAPSGGLQFRWLDSFTPPADPSTGTGSSGGGDKPKDESGSVESAGLGIGPIIGIAVGCVVAVAAVGLLLYTRRKRQQQQQQQPPQQQQQGGIIESKPEVFSASVVSDRPISLAVSTPGIQTAPGTPITSQQHLADDVLFLPPVTQPASRPTSPQPVTRQQTNLYLG